MDQFRSSPKAVLVATDVAARGLDIPHVDHVIHYDLPRSLEVFLHRSGRTARAQREGVSFSLVGPRDERMHSEVCRVLLPAEDTAGTPGSMPALPIDLVALSGCRERVNLAGKIVKHELQDSQRVTSRNWLAKVAKDAELDLGDGDEEDQGMTPVEKSQKVQLARDKKRLAELLEAPLVVGECMMSSVIAATQVAYMCSLQSLINTERRKFFDVASKIDVKKEKEGKTAVEVLDSKRKKQKGLKMSDS